MKKHLKKLQGRSGTEMTRLKAKWRKLPEDIRVGWIEFLLSEASQTEIRQRIRQELGVNLRFDQQLSRFRYWAEDEEQHNLMAGKIEERRKELLAGGMTLEQAQQVLLIDASAYSVAARDFKLGLRTSSEITKLQNATLGRDKFQFDAVVACRRELPTLKAIEADSSLTEAEKTQRFMEILFGIQPVTAPQPANDSPYQQN
jgi:hypothetical protein